MTVFRPRHVKTFRYDFWWRGHRYKGNTRQLRLEDAHAVERQLRVDLARRAGQLPIERHQTPRFQDWAEVYFQHVARRIKRPDLVERTLRIVLQFWGAPPSTRAADPHAPYHDLRLADPIEDPAWIETFEAWMGARRISGATRNSYRTAVRGMYRVAFLPQFRAVTGVTFNPFLGIPRDRVPRRLLTLTVDQLRAWVSAVT